MKSEFRQIEMFITEDGKEFFDEDSAYIHEQKLKSRRRLRKIIYLISEGYPFDIQYYPQTPESDLTFIKVKNPNFREDDGSNPFIVYEFVKTYKNGGENDQIS